MKLATVTVKNWMNFQELSDVPLHTRNYVIGANAVGKSNFLDIFRFLRDVASPAGAKPSAGGLQEAINRRDGIRKLRCLHGRKDSEVLIDVTLKEGQDSWRYVLGFKGEGKANNRVLIRQEKVFKNGQHMPGIAGLKSYPNSISPRARSTGTTSGQKFRVPHGGLTSTIRMAT